MTHVTADTDPNEVGRELVADVRRGDFDAAEQLAEDAENANIDPPSDPAVYAETDAALDELVEHEINEEFDDTGGLLAELAGVDSTDES